jgi:hypothetical protein
MEATINDFLASNGQIKKMGPLDATKKMDRDDLIGKMAAIASRGHTYNGPPDTPFGGMTQKIHVHAMGRDILKMCEDEKTDRKKMAEAINFFGQQYNQMPKKDKADESLLLEIAKAVSQKKDSKEIPEMDDMEKAIRLIMEMAKKVVDALDKGIRSTFRMR